MWIVNSSVFQGLNDWRFVLLYSAGWTLCHLRIVGHSVLDWKTLGRSIYTNLMGLSNIFIRFRSFKDLEYEMYKYRCIHIYKFYVPGISLFCFVVCFLLPSSAGMNIKQNYYIVTTKNWSMIRVVFVQFRAITSS